MADTIVNLGGLSRFRENIKAEIKESNADDIFISDELAAKYNIPYSPNVESALNAIANSNALTSPTVYILQDGAATPTGKNGDVCIFYEG